MFPDYSFGQPAAQKQGFANQFELIQQCSEQVSNMVKAMYDAYQEVRDHGQQRSFASGRFQCQAELHPFYKEQAKEKSGTLGQTLKIDSDQFLAAFERVLTHCRDLEIYFRLKNHEKDNYQGAAKIISDFNLGVIDFTSAKTQFERKIEAMHRSLKLPAMPVDYAAAERNMRALAEKELELIDKLFFNYNADLATIWPVAEIQEQINTIDRLLVEIRGQKLHLDYPASSFYGSFLDCAEQHQSAKKSLVDEYTPEEKKSSEHANRAYWQVLNYFNNCYVSFFNQFASLSPEKKSFPLPLPPATAVFKIVEKAEIPVWESVKGFSDIPYQAFQLPEASKPLSPILTEALNKYLEFIDEGVRVTNNLLTGLQNSRVNQREFPAGTHLFYSDDNHEIPKSLYQETRLQNAKLPIEARSSVQDQAEVLNRMLVEMDELRAELVHISQERLWQKLGFARVEAIRDRFRLLFSQFDIYKERLYQDLFSIYKAYSVSKPESSWQQSGRSMEALIVANRAVLDEAKAYFSKKKSEPVFDLQTLVQTIEIHIRNQYVYMKGIERIGRNNGLCPYNPYEDIAEISQKIVELAEKIYKKDFHDFNYAYNDAIREYNRFVGLSPEPLLRNISQLEIFTTAEPPVQKKQATSSRPVSAPEAQKIEQAIRQIVRDTIFIRDTIYLEKAPPVNQSFYSLEGHLPNNLILLFDISASMKTPERLPLLQSSVETLIRLLRPEDGMGLVVFSGTARVEQTPVPGDQKVKLLDAIRNLKPGGKTDIDAGLALAYDLAQKNYKNPGNNRIILATDGEFSPSDALMQRIGQNAEAGIILSIFKFGEKPTPNLKTLTNRGKGNLVSMNAENAVIYMIMEAKK